MCSKQDEVHWAPRVAKRKIARLYESDARGMLDEGLLDDVGISLYLRCESILAVAEAKHGRVRCPRCEGQGRDSFIERQRKGGDVRDALLRCPRCDWTMTWGAYAQSFKRSQLNAGGAVTAFETYVRDYPAARTPQAKLVAIDQLIHAFHYSLRQQPGLPTRPAGVNLIEGKLKDVIQFLDELTYGAATTEGLSETRADWDEEMQRFRNDFLAAYTREAKG